MNKTFLFLLCPQSHKELYTLDIDDESFFYILDRPCFLPTFQLGKERLTAARRVNLVNGLSFQNKFHRYINF